MPDCLWIFSELGACVTEINRACDGFDSVYQKIDDTVQEGQTCLGCNATSTPEWRRGPMGKDLHFIRSKIFFG